jgi:outer membrane usher protein
MRLNAGVKLPTLLFLLFSLIIASYSFAEEKLIASVFVNTELKGEAFVLITPDGDILLEREDIEEIGLKVSGEEKVVGEKTYISLRSLLPAVKFSFDDKELSLRIEADPGSFEGSTMDLSVKEPAGIEHPKQNSAFFNYSANLGLDDDFKFSALDVPLEAGIRWGDYLFYSGFSYTKTNTDESFVRLMSNIVRDDRTSMRRYIIGDFNASTRELGGGAVLGGVSLSKFFPINPAFTIHPGLDISGLLYTPSDVELIVNGTVLRREHFQPGRFEFNNIPAAAGSGETSVVIKDAFGKTETITVPFYFTPRLLKTGLNEYSYNAGFIRENKGKESFDYGDYAALLLHRYGFSDKFTGGIRAEFSKDLLSSGVSADFLIKKIGSFNASAAYSINHKNGYAYSLGYSYSNNKKGISLRALLREMSRDYSNISLKPEDDRSKTEIIFFAGYSSKKLGSLSLSYNFSDKYIKEDQRRVSIRYTRRLSKKLNLDITLSNIRGEDTTNEFMITLRYLFNQQTSGSLSYRNTNGEGLGSLSIQRIPDLERGLAYRVMADYGATNGADTENYEAELGYYGDYGIYTAGYRSTGGSGALSLKASGGMAVAGSSIFFGKPVSDSFAIVRVPKVKDITVYYNNSLPYKTNSTGEAFIPRLASYQYNKLSIEENDVPLNLNVKSLNRYISPQFRSGSFIEFEVEKIQSAVGKLSVLEDGKEMPAVLWLLQFDIKDKAYETQTGKDGEFYLENVPPGSYKAAILKGEKTCAFDLVIPESEELTINLGGIPCKDIGH